MTDSVAEVQNEQPEGEQEQKVDNSELMAQLKRLEASNKRVVEESKSWKAKYQNVKAEVEQKETEQLQASNDFKGLYEKTLEEKQRLEEESANSKKSALETTLKYEVAKNAKDADDMDILLAAIKVKKKDLLGYDKENGQWLGVKEAIDELRTENSGLFVKDKPGMVNGRPGAIVSKDKTIEEQIAEDPTGVLNSALKDLLS